MTIKKLKPTTLARKTRARVDLGIDAKTMNLLRKAFDTAFYLSKNPDVADADSDPLIHYLEFGASELRDPSPKFSTSYYASKHANVIPEDMNPLVHYVLTGSALGLSCVPEISSADDLALIEDYFDEKFYVGQGLNVAQWKGSPATHYIAHGGEELRDPNAMFSAKFYKKHYMHDKTGETNPFVHFLRFGIELVYNDPPKLTDKELKDIAAAFDSKFYISTYFSGVVPPVDPLRHYITVGWLLGYDPSKSFSTAFYAKAYRDRYPAGTNPLVHYILAGRKSGLAGHHLLNETALNPKVMAEFDDSFYKFVYPHLCALGLDLYQHYMISGWKEGTDPNKYFSTVFYRRAYPDVAESGLHPLVHYVLHGQGRATHSERPGLHVAPNLDRYSEAEIFSRCQDLSFPISFETTKRLLVIVIPEHNEMSGGIYSMFSIAAQLKKTKAKHGYDVMVMTNPNSANYTYFRQRNFRNNEDVFRFEQIVYCRGVEELYLHIPEYAADGFIDRCSTDVWKYLSSRKKLHINILNQNIELMPEIDKFSDLRRISDELTQSVAHHAYFNQEQAEKYQLPTLLLPAYTDLSEYTPITGIDKEDIILYSLDEAWYKQQCLASLRTAFPNYRLIEVRSISFDHYMDLATRCRFSISFGEGFDGYVAQPIYQGGIGFTVFREEFFPSPDFLNFPNFFKSDADLITNIVPLMKQLESDVKQYDELNKALVRRWDELYSVDEYREQIAKLVTRKFEIFPKSTQT